MIDETIVAVYDTPAQADAAVRDLLAANVPADSISQHSSSTTADRSASAVAPGQEHGFWSRLFGGEPDHDPSVYDRSVASGATVVTVRSPADFVSFVSEILDRHGPADLDERASRYGLTPAAKSASASPQPVANPVPSRNDAETLQLSEEQLAVGTRLVDRGTTRVRRFVTEVPVEQQVTLHDESVRIERRPVVDALPLSDGAFTDRTIEMTETAEEAVIGKTAHVYEEVALRKQATEHVETVRDTVRREDVEVTQVPNPAAKTDTRPSRN